MEEEEEEGGDDDDDDDMQLAGWLTDGLEPAERERCLPETRAGSGTTRGDDAAEKTIQPSAGET